MGESVTNAEVLTAYNIIRRMLDEADRLRSGDASPLFQASRCLAAIYLERKGPLDG